MAAEIDRLLQPSVEVALADTRVVGIVGPRQAGKSTLARRLVDASPNASYVTLDDLTVRTTIEADPRGFVSGRPGLLAIDEVQRIPELMLAIKAEVDTDQRPGRFLVTGSTQLSATLGVSETLAGRIERFELWPFSRSELAGTKDTFIDRLLDAQPPPVGYRGSMDKAGYLKVALAGGFPEAIRRAVDRRAAWFEAYVETVIEREAPGVTASPRTAELPRLLRLVASRHGGLLNLADLGRVAGLAQSTVTRYLDVLEAVFLVRRLPAWSINLGKRETRAPKVFITDPGLAGHLRDADLEILLRPEQSLGADGPLIEGLVFTELLRQAGWSSRRARLYHFRERDLVEVDFVVEDNRRHVAGVEVKAAIDISARDVRHLASLRDRVGEQFVMGVLLYCGARVLSLGDRLWAVPLSALWDAA